MNSLGNIDPSLNWCSVAITQSWTGQPSGHAKSHHKGHQLFDVEGKGLKQWTSRCHIRAS